MSESFNRTIGGGANYVSWHNALCVNDVHKLAECE